MNREEVFSYVESKVRERARGGKPLGSQTNIVAEGIVDSFAFLELLSEIEQYFKIQIDPGDHDFETLTTLGGLVDVTMRALPPPVSFG